MHLLVEDPVSMEHPSLLLPPQRFDVIHVHIQTRAFIDSSEAFAPFVNLEMTETKQMQQIISGGCVVHHRAARGAMGAHRSQYIVRILAPNQFEVQSPPVSDVPIDHSKDHLAANDNVQLRIGHYDAFPRIHIPVHLDDLIGGEDDWVIRIENKNSLNELDVNARDGVFGHLE